MTVIKQFRANLRRRSESGFRIRSARFCLIILISSVAFAQTYTESILHSFSGSTSDGAFPTSGLVIDAAGNLYGTTYYGGTSNYGTVFKLTSGGTESVLHSFVGFDGANPAAGLLRDGKGNLYGTTQNGGTMGVGTVFEIPNGQQEEVLYSFQNQNDGRLPFSNVTKDKSGNLYFTTVFGGFDGVLGRLSSSDVETPLHSFEGSGDGMFPFSGVVLDSAGNIFGTTSVGGSSSCPELGAFGCGVIYEYTISGELSILHTFVGTDGRYPYYGSLVRDAHGNLFGTTYQGGTRGYGTVFKLTSGGVLVILHNFGGGRDGAFPVSGLIEDSTGNLYGTTYQGGTLGFGTVFKLTAAGVKTILYNFTSANGDGAYPMSALVRDSSGNLYGTTQSGGKLGMGAVFKLLP